MHTDSLPVLVTVSLDSCLAFWVCKLIVRSTSSVISPRAPTSATRRTKRDRIFTAAFGNLSDCHDSETLRVESIVPCRLDRRQFPPLQAKPPHGLAISPYCKQTKKLRYLLPNVPLRTYVRVCVYVYICVDPYHIFAVCVPRFSKVFFGERTARLSTDTVEGKKVRSRDRMPHYLGSVHAYLYLQIMISCT